jgi:predicted transcriptional regulator
MANREEASRVRAWIVANANGMTVHQAAEALGMKINTLRYHLKTLGATIVGAGGPQPGLIQIDIKQIESEKVYGGDFDYVLHFLTRNKDKMSCREMAQKLGVSEQTIRNKAKGTGFTFIESKTQADIGMIRFREMWEERIKTNEYAAVAWERFQDWLRRQGD